jgi:phage terminase large subunit-like protein
MAVNPNMTSPKPLELGQPVVLEFHERIMSQEETTLENSDFYPKHANVLVQKKQPTFLHLDAYFGILKFHT